MALDYTDLELLWQNHPSWKLLRARNAPLIASFLYQIFVVPNVRSLPQSSLSEVLEDTLFSLRERYGDDAFSASAQSYLNDWADNDKGWLRKFYPPEKDEPHYDLTPATEKVLSWLEGLTERSFVGTESRLLTLIDLLRQISEGSQEDPQLRIEELQKRRRSIDNKIERILNGDIPMLDDTALKDRFQQFIQMARELLRDFREVEHNFRALDRHVRERIALWEGSKGALLEEIMGERDAITDSDQGRSFHAFWDFLMSQSRQEELTGLLDQILSLSPIQEMQPEPRLRWVHYDWLEAGEHTQRTVARLSAQLRRFLDDRAWLENRRIMDILHSIENNALALRSAPPKKKNFMEIDETSPSVELPLERPLYQPPFNPVIDNLIIDEGDAEIDLEALYAQVVIDRAELSGNIRQALQERGRVTLSEVMEQHPLRHGLAELVTYLQLASERKGTAVDDKHRERVSWNTEDGTVRQATLPRIILVRD